MDSVGKAKSPKALTRAKVPKSTSKSLKPSSTKLKRLSTVLPFTSKIQQRSISTTITNQYQSTPLTFTNPIQNVSQPKFTQISSLPSQQPLTPSNTRFQQQQSLFTTSTRSFMTQQQSMLNNFFDSTPKALKQFILQAGAYGKQNKIKKKVPQEDKNGSNGGSGGDSPSNDNDNNNNNNPKKNDNDDDKDKKDKKDDVSKDKKDDVTKDKKDDVTPDSKPTPKAKIQKLGNIFDLTPQELEELSKPLDSDKNKKGDNDTKDSKDDKDTPPSKSDKKNKKGNKKDKKKNKDRNSDSEDSDEDDDDFKESLHKLGGKTPKEKKEEKEKEEKGDDDDEDDGPNLTPKQRKIVDALRIIFNSSLFGLFATSLYGSLKRGQLRGHATSNSYEQLRTNFLSTNSVEKFTIRDNEIVTATIRKTDPQPVITTDTTDQATTTTTTPPTEGQQQVAPDHIDVSTETHYMQPTVTTIPNAPDEYTFGVLDLGVFSRQLQADLHQLKIPDLTIYHLDSFTLSHGIHAMFYLAIFYAIVRKSIDSKLGWFFDKPKFQPFGSMGKDLKMLQGVEKKKQWKFIKDIKTRFTDVAGMDESKAEIVEFVDFLKNPDKYHQVGAKLPKGALLHGPPGTGKTLLAKAVAGEAGVPFISASGSEFVQMYVGMGAKRVRELFDQARKNAPCIVFIDEVDAIARRRDAGQDHDERESTLNQLLVEMDGFKSNEKIIILAATNRLDMLDKAFTRPGRIDRKVLVELPDLKGRKEVFKVHLAKVKHSYDPEELGAKLAALTPGCSGADIENICNEAAIFAARGNQETIELVNFEQAIDRTIAGLKKQHRMQDDQLERKIVAYHESGHAVAGWFLEHADPLLKVTITPRTNGALGFAQYLPKQSGIRQTEELYDRLCVALGGRAAEEIFFQKISTGASDDLKKVTNMAQSMVVEWGMSPKLPNMVFPEVNNYNTMKPMSDRTSEIIDDEVTRIVHEQYSRVKELLVSKKPQLEILSETLLKEETINHDTIVRVLGPRPFQNDEYVEFMHQNKKKLLTPEEKAILGIKDETTITTVNSDGTTTTTTTTTDDTTPPTTTDGTTPPTTDGTTPPSTESTTTTTESTTTTTPSESPTTTETPSAPTPPTSTETPPTSTETSTPTPESTTPPPSTDEKK